MVPEYISIPEHLSDGINYKYKLMSIDVGINNLGISITVWDESWEKHRVIWVELIDVNVLTHNNVNRRDCNLHHTRHLVDKMEHLFQEYNNLFEQVDYIIVELQPILGLKAVESLIFNKYRNKTFLVHPVKMHMFFNIKKHDYEKRKEFTIKIALMNIKDDEVLEQFNAHKRKHDMADSICIMKYWVSKKREQYIKEQKKIKAKEYFNTKKHVSMDDFFDRYKYKGSLK